MTRSEAVGLVLLAGLSGQGHLCVLEMGEPIRILDLARLMITISGSVPDRDIEIVFTGLRPGEKLEERLMSDREAARSRAIGDRVRSVDVEPPSAETLAAIDELERIARSGDRRAVVAAIQRALPDYRPSPLWGPPASTPGSAP
jgi:FlaA1/EpsC-like NDP-sugar epimerase